MTATVTRLRPSGTAVFVIDVSSDGPLPIGTFDTSSDIGVAMDGLTVDVVCPTFMAGTAKGEAPVVADGEAGRELLRRATQGAFRMRCRAVPDNMRWKLIGVAE